jgi:hypothetical protein
LAGRRHAHCDDRDCADRLSGTAAVKPKFNIPLQVSTRELEQLIKMYAERLYRQPWDEVEAPTKTWIGWNMQRMAELVALLEKK